MLWNIILFSILSEVLCFEKISFQGGAHEKDSTCLPTSKVTGPCHSCVCSDDGAYHCVPKECDPLLLNSGKQPTDATVLECEANAIYRDGELWCSCSPKGRWRSRNCRSTFDVISLNLLRDNKPSIPNALCQSDNYYAVDCNVCSCKNGKLKSCTSRTCGKKLKTDKCNHGEALRLEKELCVCSSIGQFTDKLCTPLPNNKITKVDQEQLATITRENVQPNPAKHKCEPGTVFQIDCNRCKCTMKGHSLCTDKLCLDHPEFKTQISNSSYAHSRYRRKLGSDVLELKSLDEPCIPGKHYTFGCNSCYCTSKGHASCTSMLCMYDDVGKLNSSKKQKRRKELEDYPDPPEKCVPGRSYKANDSCNRCYCTQQHDLQCTRIGCLSSAEAKLFKQSARGSRQKKSIRYSSQRNENTLPKTKCVPGEIYKKGCQRCFCTDKKIALCTNKPCEEMKTAPHTLSLYDVRPSIIHVRDGQNHETLPHEAAKCEPGKTYKVECNFCSCKRNGDTICTHKLCASFEDVNRIAARPYNGKACKKPFQPEECVKCDCVKGKSECEGVDDCRPPGLRRYLHGDDVDDLALDPDGKNCVPGMAYKQQCNRCYCQEDGSMRCTRKGCLSYQQIQKLAVQREKLMKQEGIQPVPAVQVMDTDD